MCIKRSILTLGAIILFSLASQAESIYLWPVIAKARGERNDQQALELNSNQWPSFGASYSFDRWMISLDRSLYNSDSDSGNVSIQTKYSDIAVWGGYSLFQGDMWDLFAVAGTGVYQQKVITSVSGLSTTNHSHDKSLVGMGAEYLMRTPSVFALVAGARLNWTQDLDPEIMPELYLKIGVGF
jgi:hypothetical protein